MFGFPSTFTVGHHTTSCPRDWLPQLALPAVLSQTSWVKPYECCIYARPRVRSVYSQKSSAATSTVLPLPRTRQPTDDKPSPLPQPECERFPPTDRRAELPLLTLQKRSLFSFTGASFLPLCDFPLPKHQPPRPDNDERKKVASTALSPPRHFTTTTSKTIETPNINSHDVSLLPSLLVLRSLPLVEAGLQHGY